eukprot:2794107-Prorocentrum_lima.AAC.1
MVAPSSARSEGRGRGVGSSSARQRERWATYCCFSEPSTAALDRLESQSSRSAESCLLATARRREALSLIHI